MAKKKSSSTPRPIARKKVVRETTAPWRTKEHDDILDRIDEVCDGATDMCDSMHPEEAVEMKARIARTRRILKRLSQGAGEGQITQAYYGVG